MDFTLFEQELFGNPLREYVLCFSILFFGFLIKKFGAGFISRQSFRFLKGFSRNQFSDVFVQLEKKTLEQFITLLILYFAFDQIH